MKKLSRILLLLFAAILSLTATVSCARSFDDEEIKPEIHDGYVNLKLAVSIPEGAKAPRVGYELTDEAYPGAEQTVGKHEMINRLRVIITDQNGIVDVNTLISLEQAAASVSTRKFKVKANEVKTVYLLANEPVLLDQGLDNMTYYTLAHEGDLISNDLLHKSIKLTAQQLSSMDIPMSAVYRLPVNLQYTGEEIETIEYNDLKLIRQATKFTVEITNTQPQGMFAPNPFKIHVKDMSISSVSDRSYIFPHVGRGAFAESMLQSMTYRPDGTLIETATNKAPAVSGGSNRPLDGSYTDYYRENYRMPNDPVYTDWRAPEGYQTVTIGKNETHTFPSFYGNESLNIVSDTQKYFFNCTIVDTEGNDAGTFSQELPNLSALPRNTHVVIKANFVPQQQKLEVTVVPYVGVTLDPIFGLNTPPGIVPDPPEEEPSEDDWKDNPPANPGDNI
ncbi:MAG: hypothetical protein K2N91_00815 [Muribaculaceae bacterium]|nr:hypothetical protein [Muribaculaceae bacterium]